MMVVVEVVEDERMRRLIGSSSRASIERETSERVRVRGGGRVCGGWVCGCSQHSSQYRLPAESTPDP